MNRIDALFFDVDGTLFDHDTAVATALQTMLHQNRFKTESTLDEVVRHWRHLEELHFKRYLSGECTLTQERRDRVAAFLHPDESRTALCPSRLDDWFLHFVSVYRKSWCAYEDVVPTLSEIAARRSKLKIGIITNGDGAQQRDKIVSIGLGHLLANTFVSSELGAAKPASKIFHMACHKLGVEPRRAMYVGDRLDIDAEAAVDAGLRGVWMNRSGSSVHTPGVHSIKRMKELVSLVLTDTSIIH